MKGSALLALLTLCVGSLQAQRPDPSPSADRISTEPAAAAWMKSNLVPFETDIPTTLELRPLVGMLQSAQLLGLGESTHGDHQSQVFKSQLIRRLIADQGLQQVVFEINRSAGQALDDYVNKGQGDFADVIRNDGVFKIWQTDDFASLIAWMRAYVKKTGRSIRVYGIDCQMPGKDLSTVVSFLKKVDPRTADQTAKTYRSLFDADSQGKTYFAWLKSRSKSDYPVYSKPAAALEQLLETNKASWCKVAGFDDAVYAARTAFQAFNAFELDFGGLPSDMSKYNALYLSRRDRFMAQNVLWRIGNNRACLWAHNGHVLGRPGDATLGSLLSAKLGAKYVTVGFTWSQGVIHVKSVSGSSVDLVALQNAAFPQVALNANRSGDLGEFLGRLGYDRFYIDLRRADEGTKKWGKVPYYLPSIGWLFNPRGFLGDVNQASPTIPSYDILVYSRKISPSTLWFP